VDPSSTPESAGQAIITQGGQSTTVDLNVVPPWGGTSLYQCSGDTLLIDSFTPSGVDGQYVTYNRSH
jgi:hypothetical protein